MTTDAAPVADPARLRRDGWVKWTAVAPDVLPATVAEMDFGVPYPVRAAVAAAAAHGRFGYAADADLDRLAERWAERVGARTGWRVDPACVVVGGAITQLLHAVLQTATDPGDRVVVLTPSWPMFAVAIRAAGATVAAAPLAVDAAGGWAVDVDALHAAAHGARALVLCHPHNPTGRRFDRAELSAIHAVAAEHDLLVISDEVWSELLLDGDEPHVPFASIDPDAEARAVTLTSAGKSFNIAGLPCAFAAFADPERRNDFVRAHPPDLMPVARPAVAAVAAAWRDGDAWSDDVRARLRRNRDLLARRLPEVAGLRWTPPQATYLAWLDLRATALAPDPAAAARARGVALDDGAAYGADGAGWLRLNFATSTEVLDELVDRLRA